MLAVNKKLRLSIYRLLFKKKLHISCKFINKYLNF